MSAILHGENVARRENGAGGLQDKFHQLACLASNHAGKPAAFLAAASVIALWAAAGPFFDFSETWQLVVNTGTTIVTFLMVFLIQHAQNRDAAAVQLKLSELVVAVKEANSAFAVAEELSEEELDEARREIAKRARGDAA